MTSVARRVLAVALLALLAAAAFAIALKRHSSTSSAQRPALERPALMLLTSLPLLFSEDFSLSGGSPALGRLRTQYRVVPISVTSAQELRKGRLLLLAQPLTQTAENLVALDDWVREGGRVLLLADPQLEWPSRRPLGDRLRPPAMFMDTGLLAHWGLHLDAPDSRGPERRKLGNHDILAVSPGALDGRCPISADRFVAHCALGRGRATVVADADFLNTETLGTGADGNLLALLEELAQLEHS